MSKLKEEVSYVIIGDKNSLKKDIYPLVSSKYKYTLKLRHLFVQNIDHYNCDLKIVLKCNAVTQRTNGDFSEEKVLQMLHLKSPPGSGQSLDYLFFQEEYICNEITDFYSLIFNIDIVTEKENVKKDSPILDKCLFYLHFDILTYLI